MTAQPGILSDLPAAARFLSLHLRTGADPRAALTALAATPLPPSAVVGLGAGLVARLGKTIPGLRPMPALQGPGAAIPATPVDLWLRIEGDDPGVVLHRSRGLLGRLPDFVVAEQTDGFRHRRNRDLSGYEDGTENPEGEAAAAAALCQGAGPGLDGGSVVAVQRWVHDGPAMDALDKGTMDRVVGRDRDSNEELADAPPSAHVKRAAQEDFEPEAFVVRRSMPWTDARGFGLVFIAFGRDLDAFEAILRRMVGLEDGVVDGLFRFTRPVTGHVAWCPPLRQGHLDLSALDG